MKVDHINGTNILPAGTATTHPSLGTYSFNLPAQATPATLKITWSGDQTRVEYVDVIGRFLVDLAEIRALDGVSDTVTYPTALLAAKRDAAEDLFEQVTGAWTSRYSLDILDGDSTYRRAYMPVESSWVYEPNLSRRLMLEHKNPRVVLSVSIADPPGSAFVTDTAPTGYVGGQTQYLADFYKLYPWGEIERSLVSVGWPRGVENVRIEYLYGRLQAPQQIRDAMLVYVRHLVLNSTSRISPRATTIVNPEGGTVQLATALDWQRPTGISEVDAVLRRYDERDLSVA